MTAIEEFEHNLATLLDCTKMKLSIVKGQDKQYHLQGESWIYPEPFYLDEFLNIDFSKNMFRNNHIMPLNNSKK